MQILKLYIDQNVRHSPHVIAIRSRIPNVPVSIVRSTQEVYQSMLTSENPVEKGKTTLFLTRNKGAFIKECPGTRSYTCCGYQILHVGTFCTMDCSYCILQTYFHPPVLQYFVNHGDLKIELDRLFLKKTLTRIGTGEFTDSMIWDNWTDLSHLLVNRFSKQSKAVLELKTKTAAVNSLKALCHNRKTIVSWSLNTSRVIKTEERHTASLSARLRAASNCERWGYPLGFHFDPLILYDGCEEEYLHVVKQLFGHVSPENIVWISLGTFRFMPALKSVIQKRFPSSKIIYGEFISGLDGKMRYFKPLRIDLYRKVVSFIREHAPDVTIYLCMEDDEVWQKSLGFVPSDYGGLPRILDESAAKHCGLDIE
ncbi:MAG: DNA photolyase [Desulfobacterales bacterium]